MQSNDGSTTLTGTVTTRTFGFYTSYQGSTQFLNYVLQANLTGSLATNGSSQAVIGYVSQTLTPLTYSLPGTTGTIQTGVIAVGVADTGNNRIVRTADALACNWSSLGAAGAGQLSNPEGIFVDSGGKIYVADTGNNRMVTMNDMSGTGFTSLGAAGSGTAQFASPAGVTVDTAGKIYIADTKNYRLVRVDNIAGTNWTTLSNLSLVLMPVGPATLGPGASCTITVNFAYGSGVHLNDSEREGRLWHGSVRVHHRRHALVRAASPLLATPTSERRSS